MQSRRDQIQAHSFVMGRLAAGVLRIDVDGPDHPVQRTKRGTIIGLVIGIVACIGVAVYGLIVPGGSNTGWEQPGTLVIDSGTGARFLYTGGALRPVLNVTSARLVAGSQLNITTVGSDSLRGVPRGAPFGIADAPDALPADNALVTGSWSACATTDRRGSAAPRAQFVLGVGISPSTVGLTAGQGVVVAGADGIRYLLWAGRRLRLDPGHGVTQALGYSTITPMPVTAGFLDAVPAGPDLTPPQVGGLGEAGPELSGRATTVGQLFTDAAGHHYLLTARGLTPLNATLFALLSGDPAIQQGAYGGAQVTTLRVGPSDLAGHTATAGVSTAQAAGLPPVPPEAVGVSDQQAACVTLQPGGGAVAASVEIGAKDTVELHAAAPYLGPGIVRSCRPADLVAVQPGSGALVSVTTVGGGPGSTDYLVTDAGVKFPIASAAAAQQLGYSDWSQVTLPATVLALLPTGPSLDPAELTNGGIVSPASPLSTCDD
jgi:type VII secretion protein EccB